MTISMPVANEKSIKISFKKLFFPLLLFVAVVVAFVNFSELQEIGQLFARAKWYWIVVALGSQFLNFFLQANVYRATFKIFGFPHVSLKKLIKAGVMVVFLNYTIPSLGMAGHFNLFRILRKNGIKEGKALLAILVEVFCFYIGFVLVILLSLFYLFFTLGNVGHTQIIAAAGAGAILLTIAIVSYSFLGGKKQRSQKRIAWMIKKFDTPENGESEKDRAEQLLKDFHQDFGWIRKNKKKLIRPATLQFAKFLSDGLTIFLIFLAFGKMVPIGLGVVAFVFGRLFGMLSFIPGGLGAFEGAMVLIFNSLGITLEMALSVMLIYRFYSFWLYFPLGLIFYKQINNKKLQD